MSTFHLANRVARALLSLPVLLCGTVSAQSAGDATELVRGNGPEPSTLDAHRCQEVACGNILRDLYEGLVTENAQGEIIPGAAASWTMSTDGREWEFRLREELRWSNGEALTAADFVASMRRALAPATAAPMAGLLRGVANADAVIKGILAPDALGVAAIDAHTLRIRLDQPVALLDRLLLPIALPVYLPAIAQFGAQHSRPGHLVSNGAYRLGAWTPQASVILQRNQQFHDADNVKIAQIRYAVTEDAASELKRYQAGDLEMTETVPPQSLTQLRATFGEELRISPYLGTFWLGLNLSRPPMRDDPALREALLLAIDRDILTRHVTGLGESPAWTIIPPGVRDYRAAPTALAGLSATEREQRARERYRAAGYDVEHPLSIEIRYNTSTLYRKLALAVAAMWRQTLGVHVVLRNEEWKVFVQNRRQRVITQVFRGGWIADVNDPLDFLATFAGAANPLNNTAYVDAEFDRLLTEATALAPGTARSELLARAETRLLDAYAVVPIFFYTSKHLLKSTIAGFEANPLDHHASRWLHRRDGEAP